MLLYMYKKKYLKYKQLWLDLKKYGGSNPKLTRSERIMQRRIRDLKNIRYDNDTINASIGLDNNTINVSIGPDNYTFGDLSTFYPPGVITRNGIKFSLKKTVQWGNVMLLSTLINKFDNLTEVKAESTEVKTGSTEVKTGSTEHTIRLIMEDGRIHEQKVKKDDTIKNLKDNIHNYAKNVPLNNIHFFPEGKSKELKDNELLSNYSKIKYINSDIIFKDIDELIGYMITQCTDILKILPSKIVATCPTGPMLTIANKNLGIFNIKEVEKGLSSALNKNLKIYISTDGRYNPFIVYDSVSLEKFYNELKKESRVVQQLHDIKESADLLKILTTEITSEPQLSIMHVLFGDLTMHGVPISKNLLNKDVIKALDRYESQ
jgi:hypothetical protein